MSYEKRLDEMRGWESLKRKGSKHYQNAGKGSQTLDILKDTHTLEVFALGSILKYAHRGLTGRTSEQLISDMKKTIHYAEMIIFVEEENARSKAEVQESRELSSVPSEQEQRIRPMAEPYRNVDTGPADCGQKPRKD